MVAPKKPKVIVIAGPTASGKTGLAVALALSQGGEVINADSMQVYRGMDIGTAKPTLEERRGVCHHLLDVVDPDEDFNAARYRQMALPLAKSICARNIPCFIVGGTGLYIRALLGGLVKLPPSDPMLRERLQLECDRCGAPELYRKLADLDPEGAKSIHPNDRRRIIRALEIIHLTHRKPSDLQKEHRFQNQEFCTLKLYLQVERERLYDRINARTEKMVAEGLIQETKLLLAKGYDPHLKSMTAIGYRHITLYLQGKWPLEKATEALKQDTRKYAKRQMTWFKAEQDMIGMDPENKILAEEKIRAFMAKSA